MLLTINSLSPSLSVTNSPAILYPITLQFDLLSAGAAINAVAIKASSVSIALNCFLISFDVLFITVSVIEDYCIAFLVLSDEAEIIYKTTDFYSPEHEHCLKYNDKKINITWPSISSSYLLSPKDAKGQSLA